ncbi:hypothetical protein Agabi119p4_10119 [Agaricus bisporus var. burnettii]|uniref:Uncharacterized protein n=1 Tax=Agaricus bisporus var. burnettii TaxID=192524 RepID=A0A8H7C2C5_AGABI|nr:hypothetical protein Agabi119p4_10119 [Agaricus bisporus var. burnettii]
MPPFSPHPSTLSTPDRRSPPPPSFTTRGGELLPPPPPLLRPTTFWRKTRRSGVTGASYSPSSHLIRRSTYIAAGLQFDSPIHDLSALCVESRVGLSPRQLVLPGAGSTTFWWPFPPPPSSTSDIASSTYASYIASSITPSLTPTPTPTSSSLPHNVKHTFNILYLIPVFAVVGLSILVAIIWLTHGCCTRKPKYRSLPRPQQVDDAFKAWKYEDILPLSCQHTKEYGFQCDCLGDEGGGLDDMKKVYLKKVVMDHDLFSSESPLSKLERDSVLMMEDKYTVVPGRRPRSTPITEEERLKRMVQKRRLQNHRESIASLPAGMVFSPPVVGVCGFAE